MLMVKSDVGVEIVIEEDLGGRSEVGSASILLVDGGEYHDDCEEDEDEDEDDEEMAVYVGAQAVGKAVSVTHVVSQLAVGMALILFVVGSGVVGGCISVVGTADQLHIVPAAEADDASAVHVDGVGAPDDSGIQHCA